MSAKSFIKNNFLLENKYSEQLYHDYAHGQPIIDYHCHLPPKDIAENRQFENITQAWINGDHYKWRAMRTMGVDEKNITGSASDKDKFLQWAKVVPYTLRNPLYHWTHLELERYFNIDILLNEKTAEYIYSEASTKINSPEFSCQNILKRMNVETVCTTEDPIDSLEHHKKIASDPFGVKVSTAFRPDNAILIQKPGFNTYLDKLSAVSDTSINTYKDLLDALRKRIEYFHQMGCRLSDHGLDKIYYSEYTESEVNGIFGKRRSGGAVNETEAFKFQSAILVFLSECYHEHGWVQQFHLGALRNNNSRMEALLGPDTGWDSIGDLGQAESLSKFLNALDSNDKLAKTILYNLNPSDNEVLASMIGNFNYGSIKGKIQFGSGWWFLDQKDGMIKQMNALSNMGLISCFVGMLTDSRSFLSYPRHEYFRRILCNLFGEEIRKGELPHDMEWIGKIISDICYNNAKQYFTF